MTLLYATGFARGANICAKASSVIVFGKLCVTEMGRWSEKKVAKARAIRKDQYVGTMISNFRNIKR